MRKSIIIISILILILIPLLSSASEIVPDAIPANAINWLHQDSKSIEKLTAALGYETDNTAIIMNGRLYSKKGAVPERIMVAYDTETNLTNYAGFIFAADSNLFNDCYNAATALFGNAEITPTQAIWINNTKRYTLLCSMFEFENYDKATLFELQTGKYGFMFTIVNNTPTEEAVEETATPHPTATPQPKRSKVAVRTAKVERNDYGRYELSLRLQNNETSSVDRVDFYVRCYNAYGELTKAYNHYDMTELCYDLTIRSGALSDPDLYWRLNGYSDIKAVEIAVKKYHTTDGKTVEIPDDELSWKKF